MQRRAFIAGFASAATSWPTVAAQAQQRTLPVIGWLHSAGPEAHRALMPAFQQGLLEIGYVEGRNVAIEHRWAEGRGDRQPALIADLMRRQVAVMVTDTTGFAALAKKTAPTTPIVFASAGGDPVEFGLVESLNRPGGSATGVALLGIEITGKRLELLRKLVPTASTVAAFVTRGTGLYAQGERRDLQSAARSLGLPVQIFGVATEEEIAAAFASLAKQPASALLVGSGIANQQARDQIILLAARHAIPTMFWDNTSAEAGALSSYGPDFVAAYRDAGRYTGRILKGEKPADLPVIQPTKFEFVLNLKTARVLDVKVPELVLALADRVIE